jgi:hypothetical protein
VWHPVVITKLRRRHWFQAADHLQDQRAGAPVIQVSPIWISRNGPQALFGAADTGRSNPAQNQQYDEDDHDYPDDTDPIMTEAVAVTAEAATEATKQKDDEDNDEYKSERHGLSPLVDPDGPGSPMSSLIFTLPLREMPYYFVSNKRPRSWPATSPQCPRGSDFSRKFILAL